MQRDYFFCNQCPRWKTHPEGWHLPGTCAEGFGRTPWNGGSLCEIGRRLKDEADHSKADNTGEDKH